MCANLQESRNRKHHGTRNFHIVMTLIFKPNPIAPSWFGARDVFPHSWIAKVTTPYFGKEAETLQKITALKEHISISKHMVLNLEPLSGLGEHLHPFARQEESWILELHNNLETIANQDTCVCAWACAWDHLHFNGNFLTKTWYTVVNPKNSYSTLIRNNLKEQKLAGTPRISWLLS